MKIQYLELNPWHKRQAALIHHFTSMDYLKGLLPQIDSLLAMTDQMLDERSHLDTAGRALAGWESQDTASHFSTYAYPALMEFRECVVEDIALRSIERYRGAGEHQCARLLEEYAYQMAWATPEQEKLFHETAERTFDYARQLSRIVARPSTMDDFVHWHLWNEGVVNTHRVPKFRIRTDIVVRTNQVPPRSGIYVAKDDPMVSLQFAWTGGYGELCPAMALNDTGRAVLKQVGREGLWGDTVALYRFLDANRHLDPYGWSDVQSDLTELAPSAIAVSSFDMKDCEWHFVEPIPDAFEDIDGSYAGTDQPDRRPDRVAAGKRVPVAGWWYTPAQGSRRFFKEGDVFPAINSDWGDTFWIWAADQTPPTIG
ncbi:hypothetical protein NJH49_06870 [Stenotrophomonas maltophilia]|uniref:hypothetical protein n=1 Tax=Stenotrophomonas maltophilia TaxID=40324 RepID=UPI0020979950|nr:hypothetical protein [Stenotrophomonas maltophilia]MCO7400560.1 hypothetical protein [Stenotrophomonas maltophilia]MCO7411107.1 hypothetical protein [Stenotrophomonas maltophilia]HDS1558289.1 hypothetical protein [Stenotrophomonas maltophilia]